MVNRISKSLMGLALGIGMVAVALPACSQTHAIHTSGQVVSHYVLTKGTPEFEQARAFLARSSARQSHLAGAPQTVAADSVGNLYITVTHQIVSSGYAAASVPAPPPAPWVPSAAGAAPGDTASISTCGGGWEQKWTVEYVQISPGVYAWQTISYSVARKTMCTPGGF